MRTCLYGILKEGDRMVRCLDLVNEEHETSGKDQLGTLKRNGRFYKT